MSGACQAVRFAGAAIEHGARGDAPWQLVLTGLTGADPTARDGARAAFRASLVPAHLRPKLRAVFSAEHARGDLARSDTLSNEVDYIGART